MEIAETTVGAFVLDGGSTIAKVVRKSKSRKVMSFMLSEGNGFV